MWHVAADVRSDPLLVELDTVTPQANSTFWTVSMAVRFGRLPVRVGTSTTVIRDGCPLLTVYDLYLFLSLALP
jgi:hypothetical protein